MSETFDVHNPVDLRKRQVLSERRFIGRTGGQYGPMQITVRVVRVDGCKATADGWHRASYFVYDHNDRQMFGGVADHLPTDGVPRDVHGVEIDSAGPR